MGGSDADERTREYQKRAREMDNDRDMARQSFINAQQQYQKVLDGTAPSFAQQLMNQGLDQNIAQQYALAASSRGRDPGAAARQASMAAAQMGQDTAAKAGMLRAQEMEAARQGLQQGALNRIGQTNQLYLGQGQIGAGVGAQEDSQSFMNNVFKPLVSAGGQAAGYAMHSFSDENLKTDIKDGSKAIRSFLDHISAHEYRYKDDAQGMPVAGKGRYVSPMAQELEKTELGKDMVMDTPEGKVVDYGKGFGAMLAANADLHDRLKRLERGAEEGDEE